MIEKLNTSKRIYLYLALNHYINAYKFVYDQQDGRVVQGASISDTLIDCLAGSKSTKAF